MKMLNLKRYGSVFTFFFKFFHHLWRRGSRGGRDGRVLESFYFRLFSFCFVSFCLVVMI